MRRKPTQRPGGCGLDDRSISAQSGNLKVGLMPHGSVGRKSEFLLEQTRANLPGNIVAPIFFRSCSSSYDLSRFSEELAITEGIPENAPTQRDVSKLQQHSTF